MISMARLFFRVIILFFLLFYGSFILKNDLDKSGDWEFKRCFFDPVMSKTMTRFLFLNQHIMISQYYLFRMITYAITLHFPCDHEHDKSGACIHVDDPVNRKKFKVVSRYMLNHLPEFIDLDRLYKLFDLVLEFDPDNLFAKYFAMGFSINEEMISRLVKVLSASYTRNPDCEVAFDIGWLYFFHLRDNDIARLWLKRAMSFPNAPPKVEGIYTATFLSDRKYNLAADYVMSQIQSTTNPSLIPSLERRLQWYQAMDLLYMKTREYQRVYGKPVTQMTDLVEAGLIPSIPEDTMGNGFIWDVERQEPVSRGRDFDENKLRSTQNQLDFSLEEDDDDEPDHVHLHN
ncbi:MAG: hypothetical protein JW774_03785 [Candidatus Aureabacteria bacterium]|nr:hypothetical protein [Candidatus Auribacterota bacterium]